MAAVPAERSTRRLDVITAVMLGLVSVATALGAWQAAAWDAASQEFERDSGDARDVSVNQAVLADSAARADREASTTARALADQGAQLTDPLELLGLENSIDAALASTTPGFGDSWRLWREGGFDPATPPTEDPGYLVSRDGRFQSYGVAGAELDRLSNAVDDRSSVLAQASLIQALALFLFGIAGVNHVFFVRVGVLSLGSLAFLGGLVVALTALWGM
jgi:hypothetical protein